MLTQSEADTLIAMPKKRLGNQSYYFPLPGEALSIPLRSQDDREEFLIDINRGRIKLTKCTYQERHNGVIILVRLDVDGPPHTNPELSIVPLTYLIPYNGMTIECPHLHLYVEGFIDKWAVPAPDDKFVNTSDLYVTLQDFLHYCNVIDPPVVRKSITQRRLFQ